MIANRNNQSYRKSFFLSLLFFESLLSSDFFLVLGIVPLNNFSLMLQFELCLLVPVEGTIITFSDLSTTRNSGCSIVLSFTTMGNSWDWADSNILINEIFCGKFNKCIIWFNWLVFLSVLELGKFIDSDLLHGFKASDEVLRMFFKAWILGGISKSSEFAIDSLSPAGHLIINYINFLEFLLKLAEIFILLTDHTLHFKNIFILESWCSFWSSSLVSFSINFKVMKSISELFVLLLKDINFLVWSVDILK